MSPLAVGTMLIAVLLNVLSAVVLKSIADQNNPNLLLLATALIVALGLNGLRFLVWGYANRRFPLSNTYPLTSLFFPVMLAVSYAYKDPVTAAQWVGTIFITAGVFWQAWRVKTT